MLQTNAVWRSEPRRPHDSGRCDKPKSTGKNWPDRLHVRQSAVTNSRNLLPQSHAKSFNEYLTADPRSVSYETAQRQRAGMKPRITTRPGQRPRPQERTYALPSALDVPLLQTRSCLNRTAAQPSRNRAPQCSFSSAVAGPEPEVVEFDCDYGCPPIPDQSRPEPRGYYSRGRSLATNVGSRNGALLNCSQTVHADNTLSSLLEVYRPNTVNRRLFMQTQQDTTKRRGKTLSREGGRRCGNNPRNSRNVPPANMVATISTLAPTEDPAGDFRVLEKLNRFREKYLRSVKAGSRPFATLQGKSGTSHGSRPAKAPRPEKPSVRNAKEKSKEEEGTFSFGGSSCNLRANKKEEIERDELARRARAAALSHVMDEVKPLFFFNVRPNMGDDSEEPESDFSTPGFSGVLTISDSLADIGAEAAEKPPRRGIGNASLFEMQKRSPGRTNIFINNTTIVNTKGAPGKCIHCFGMK